MSRRSPRRAEDAFQRAVTGAMPQTLLARVQAAWPRAAGAAVAAQAEPVSEREGTVTVACRSATWAQELDLMQDRLLAHLNATLEDDPVTALRFTADGARHR